MVSRSEEWKGREEEVKVEQSWRPRPNLAVDLAQRTGKANQFSEKKQDQRSRNSTYEESSGRSFPMDRLASGTDGLFHNIIKTGEGDAWRRTSCESRNLTAPFTRVSFGKLYESFTVLCLQMSLQCLYFISRTWIKYLIGFYFRWMFKKNYHLPIHRSKI